MPSGYKKDGTPRALGKKQQLLHNQISIKDGETSPVTLQATYSRQ